MIGSIIAAILGNFGVVLVVVACLVTAVRATRRRRAYDAAPASHILFEELVFYGIGLNFVWVATFHAFFANFTAPLIGWAPSPFEWELAWAEYGIGLIAILSRWQGYAMRLAATLVYSVFSFGAAAQHIHQMLCCRNYNPGNAGLVLWVGDLAVPAVLLVLAFVDRPENRSPATFAARRQ